MDTTALNACYSTRTQRRRYESWFLKLLLADGSGAWWFRYLLTNLGRSADGGCANPMPGLTQAGCQPVQVWATWFPANAAPQSLIQGFPLTDLKLSTPAEPLSWHCGPQQLSHNHCRGVLAIESQTVTWDLHYQSTAGATMSNVGWIGFSRTPHSDASFTGEITFNGQTFRSAGPDQPLGYGLQGHNCGYRHRNRWTWTHCFARDEAGKATTLEALEYEIGLGFSFHRALLWHQGRLYILKKFTQNLRDRAGMRWHFQAAAPRQDLRVTVEVDGSGPSLHRLPYLKTDCSGAFEVSNNSLAQATFTIHQHNQIQQFTANAGAVLEMAGE